MEASAVQEATEAAPAAEPSPAPETPVTAPAAKPGAVSELARAIREKRKLETELAELRKAPAAPAAQPTREQWLADLKKRYEEDPEAMLAEVAGEDFYKLAARVAKKAEPVEESVKSLAERQAALEAKEAAREAERVKAEEAAADARTDGHIKQVGTIIEETDELGEPKYPNLTTLDTEVVEDPATTAYNAVNYAWQHECCKCGPDGEPIVDANGKLTVLTKWSEEEVEKRFRGAFDSLEAHYARIRTPKPKNPSNPTTPEPSPTISQHTSSGFADPPLRVAPGTMTVKQALQAALREAGLT
jgi:hypothetical protein